VEKTVENVENPVESVKTIDFTRKIAVDMMGKDFFLREFSTEALKKEK